MFIIQFRNSQLEQWKKYEDTCTYHETHVFNVGDVPLVDVSIHGSTPFKHACHARYRCSVPSIQVVVFFKKMRQTKQMLAIPVTKRKCGKAESTQLFLDKRTEQGSFENTVHAGYLVDAPRSNGPAIQERNGRIPGGILDILNDGRSQFFSVFETFELACWLHWGSVTGRHFRK